MLPPLNQIAALTSYAEQSVVVTPTSPDLLPLLTACRASSVAISLGISERVEHGYTLFNSQLHIDTTGALLGVHRKLQPTYVERAVWAQGSGHTLRTWRTSAGYNLGGLACWEHTMNGARQALIQSAQHLHAAAWPALSTMAGFEKVADAQIEALTAQVFVVCASTFVDDACLRWMDATLGPQDLLKPGGGWSAVIHPFCTFLAGPHTGPDEKLVAADVDLAELAAVKVWVDAAGHYRRPEVLDFRVDRTPRWEDDRRVAGGSASGASDAVEAAVEGGGASGREMAGGAGGALAL